MSEKNWLITGIEGFVGSHFFPALQKRGYSVFGTTWKKELADHKTIFYLDLSDPQQIEAMVQKIRPRYLALIAGFSSMRDSFQKPEECLKINYESTQHFLKAIRKNKLKTKVLIISSAMMYCPSDEILTEASAICNSSPYAESKIKQEELIKEFPEIEIVASRSFNHTGPGQLDSFIVPKLAKGFAETKENNITFELGDIDSERDFLDVRDVCDAYRILLEEPTDHNIYNVCRSQCFSVRQIINILEKKTGKKAKIIINPEVVNRNERKIILGDNRRILNNTSWRPVISFEQTVYDTYLYWQERKNEGKWSTY
ncbi:MAG: GDP-mannose 4,6-dehydratase [Nanoarchaeota archaeon]|nr:GDP-mannose 4,6-dehydratase [Nanoarchaeota archaeon]